MVVEWEGNVRSKVVTRSSLELRVQEWSLRQWKDKPAWRRDVCHAGDEGIANTNECEETSQTLCHFL